MSIHRSSEHSMAGLIRSPRSAALIILAVCAWVLWRGEQSQAALRAGDSTESHQSAQTDPVPLQVGSWSGSPVEVTDKVVDILETEDVTLMEYRRADEQPLWFAQVAGFGNRAAFHPPELCYVGSHFEVLERERITVVVGGKERRLMRLVVGQDGQEYEAWYWFTANGRVTSNYYRQQWWLVLDSMRGKGSSGTLVRISTTLDDPKKTHERLLGFVESFIVIARAKPLSEV